MEYIEKLKLEREVFSLTEIARFLGVSRQILSQWLNLERIPSGRSIENMANKWGVDITFKPQQVEK